MVYRRFGYVFSSVLLSKQEEISRMEATLRSMDKRDQAEGHELYIRSHFEDARRDSVPRTWSESRIELIGRLECKIKEYSTLR